MMRKLLALFLTLLTTLSFAQSGRLGGTITDKNDSEPLVGAHVILLQNNTTKAGVVTDYNGQYIFESITPGNYTLRISYIGYKTIDIPNIAIKAGQLTKEDIELTPEEIEVEVLEVVEDDVEVAEAILSPHFDKAHGYASEQRELYNRNLPAGFQSVGFSPLSTFSMDVDRASYTNVKRMIEEGTVVPTDAVRSEEFINAFKYSVDQPSEGDVFNFATEYSICPWNEDNRILRVSLGTEQVNAEDLPPSNMVFLVDVSGSMMGPDRIGLIKKALIMVTDQLRDEDRVSLVTYAGNTRVVLPSTPGSEKDKIYDAIQNLSAGGSTNGAGGIQLAYQQAQEGFIESGSNRVLLCTDGDFNVGISTQSELIKMISEKRQTNIFLSVVGFGSGNYQEGTMEQLANNGNGNFNYVRNLYDAKRIFVEEFGGTFFTVAKDAKIQIEFNPLFVQQYRLIGYENRMLRDEDFDNDEVDGGEVGVNHQVTAIYEIVPGDGSKDSNLNYQSSTPTGNTKEVATVSIRYKSPDGHASVVQAMGVLNEVESDMSTDQMFALSVASFAGLLREDENFKIELPEIIELAIDGKGRDENGERAGFIQLMRLYQNLQASTQLD